MTAPIAACFIALCALAGFCFWAYLKQNEAMRLDVHGAAVEQLASRLDKLDRAQDALSDLHGNALQRHEYAIEGLKDMARDVSRIDAEGAKRESLTELSDRLGRIELELNHRMAS